MLNFSKKVLGLECPMHKKLIKYLNIGKDCPLEQRIGCSSCMGGNFIDFELAEELLEKLYNNNNDNDSKEQLKIDFIHNVEQFRNEVCRLLTQMEKIVEFINMGSDNLLAWLNQLQQAQTLGTQDLRKMAERLSKHLTKDNQLIQPKINEEWQLNLNKYAAVLQKASIIINQNFLQQQLKQQEDENSATPIMQIEKCKQQINFQEEVEELKKKVEFYEAQIEKYQYQQTKLQQQIQENSLQKQTPQPKEEQVQQNDLQIEKKEILIEKKQKLEYELKKFQHANEQIENHPLWRDFLNEIDKINNQLHWLKIKFADCLQQPNKDDKQPKEKELYFCKKQKPEAQEQFSQFYLNQQIAQLQTINKLLLDSQTMYKIDNIQIKNYYKDESELKKKMSETIDYIRNHKQHHDVCQIELQYIQELMSLEQLPKCQVVNSKDLQKYFQRLTDKNKFGIFYINNNILLKNSKSLQQIIIKGIKDAQLREEIQEDRDYTLINKFAWKFISTLYFSSGPEILISDI